MGLFNFVKEAGEKLWDTVTGNASAEDQSAKLKEHLDKSGSPCTDKVDVQVVDGKAVVTGDAVSRELKEKIPWRLATWPASAAWKTRWRWRNPTPRAVSTP